MIFFAHFPHFGVIAGSLRSADHRLSIQNPERKTCFSAKRIFSRHQDALWFRQQRKDRDLTRPVYHLLPVQTADRDVHSPCFDRFRKILIHIGRETDADLRVAVEKAHDGFKQAVRPGPDPKPDMHAALVCVFQLCTVLLQRLPCADHRLGILAETFPRLGELCPVGAPTEQCAAQFCLQGLDLFR